MTDNISMNIFGKAVSWNGKTFATYFTKLHNNKTDEDVAFNVKFRQECDQPPLADCPCTIEVPRAKMNLQERIIVDKDTEAPAMNADGSVKISRNIWVSEWKYLAPFVDHSLDDFE